MTVGCGGEVPGEVLAERLKRLRNSIDLLELEFSRMASDFARTEEYDEQGFDSAISWIKSNCNMGGGAAGDRVEGNWQIVRTNDGQILTIPPTTTFGRLAHGPD